MTVSQEARSMLAMFKMLQRVGLIEKSEDFDIFYVWMREVEDYAETYKYSIINLLNLMKHIGLLEQKDFMVTWEERPKLIINQLGNFEFENPQEVYGCKIDFWEPHSFGPGYTVKFKVGE